MPLERGYRLLSFLSPIGNRTIFRNVDKSIVVIGRVHDSTNIKKMLPSSGAFIYNFIKDGPCSFSPLFFLSHPGKW